MSSVLNGTVAALLQKLLQQQAQLSLLGPYVGAPSGISEGMLGGQPINLADTTVYYPSESKLGSSGTGIKPVPIMSPWGLGFGLPANTQIPKK